MPGYSERTSGKRRRRLPAVQSALTHPLIARAREALAQGQCRRETPLTLRLPTGALLRPDWTWPSLSKTHGRWWTSRPTVNSEKELEHYKRRRFA
jgi:hypothetical protein